MLLPPSTEGQDIQLRWRLGSDSAVGGGGWRIDTLAITDANLEPTIDAFSIPSTGDEGSLLNFSATASDQNASDFLRYSWDFGDQTAPAEGAAVQHVFEDDGEYTVALTVTDARGGAVTVSQIVTVENVAPTIDSWTIPGTRTGWQSPLRSPPRPATPASLDLLSYQWDFGDESPLVPGLDATHRYTAAGVYPVTLTVEDGDGATTHVTQEITVVADAAPGDFNGDGGLNCTDIDLLVTEIAMGGQQAIFDLTGDANVDLSDRDAWLTLAGEANLGPGRSYLLGDANLDACRRRI